ncbi:hypothetical protein KIN20_008197 [Parelaphostrongylus tenuis]|uniref:DIS3-like exonuclease 2 n=1 Tax=Parelaphostrongylus tenuis TaxID=148309 RepID=A0AAD5M6H5_PARTN|nr:hypothetical protein KIN20_008197 [Parelaphostrongylus tenuis]
MERIDPKTFRTTDNLMTSIHTINNRARLWRIETLSAAQVRNHKRTRSSKHICPTTKFDLGWRTRKFEEAFIDNPDGSEYSDIAILGMRDRNRALHGDMVAFRIKPRSNWVVPDIDYQEWKEAARREDRAKDDKDSHIVTDVLDGVIESVSSCEADDLVLKEGVLPDSTLSRSSTENTEGLDYHHKCCQYEGRSVSTDKAATQLNGSLEIVDDPGNYSGMTSSKQCSYRILSELPLEEWNIPDDCLQKTAEVVGIVERKNSRLAMGRLEVSSASQRYWVKFSPTDSRLPRIMIAASQLPKEFLNRPQDFSQILFIAKILDWNDDSVMAVGEIQKQLGPAGDINVETEGLLLTSSVDVRDFPDEIISSLPSVSPEGGWKIDENEITKRRDLRNEIIFTIDPKTARDLDDALSIRACADIDGYGTPGWEVGVHIADVTYFVLEDTLLDEWAFNRATSVYLVDKVIPMLPRVLCENLCSLQPGVDRLTFSVLWKMDDKANIFDEWFGRTVIRSRVKLAYEHAQDFIENPEKDFHSTEIPEISDGVTVAEIKEKVLQLHAIAKILRQNRRQNGSLQLDQPRLNFALDDETKLPIGVSVYERKESNNLVEEFMLLANIAVAKEIEKHYETTALLRRHPPPKAKPLQNAIRTCNSIGFPISGTSSKELSSALVPFRQNTPLSRLVDQVLSQILMKAMELARYFCTGAVDSRTSYHHYALNVPLYTHFTSPIRRYPDIVVHRLLAAALNYCEPSNRSIAELETIARHCNEKKLIAKRVWETSGEIYLGVMIQRIGPIETRGVVQNVLDAAFDILIFEYGVVKRVYIKDLELSRNPIFQRSSSKLTLFWKTDNGIIEQLIQVCTIVDVVLKGLPESVKFEAVIKPKSSQESPTLFELWCDEQKCSNAECDTNVSSILPG